MKSLLSPGYKYILTTFTYEDEAYKGNVRHQLTSAYAGTIQLGSDGRSYKQRVASERSRKVVVQY